MLEEIDNEPIEWTPVVVSVLTYKAVQELHRTSTDLRASSHNLESLTKWLIALTIVLGVLAAPPAYEVVARVLSHSSQVSKQAVVSPRHTTSLETNYAAILQVKNGHFSEREYLALDSAQRDLLDLRLEKAAAGGDPVAKAAQIDVFVWRETAIDLLRHSLK
jgi:hypothetical protein